MGIEKVSQLSENAAAIFGRPTVLLALIGVFALVLFSMRVKKIEWGTQMIVNIALLLSATVVLHQIRLFHLPQGGCVTPGGMLPLLFISWRYGLNVGLLAGFLYGIIDILQDPFLLHPVQVLFDYPLPFMAMGFAALFPRSYFLGTAAAFVGRFVCHFISGIVFFGEYAPEGTSAVMWSLSVNGSMILAEGMICFALIKVLPVERLLAAMDGSASRGQTP